MGLRDYLFLSLGGAAFFLGSPALMLCIDYWDHAPFLPDSVFSTALGAFSSAVGIFFCVWANLELMRRGNGGAAVLGPLKLMKETDRLVTSGPYALSRNPMHLGIMLFQLGLSCAINSLWTLVVPLGMLCFSFALAVFVDEPRLRRDFKEEYDKWSQEVPRFLPKLKY